MRFKTCMVNDSFASRVNDPANGHIYLKALRERVVDELGLTREANSDDLQFKNFYNNSKDMIKYDVESMYNMQDINNTESIGYDSINRKTKGTNDSATQFENNHTDVFDKLLADYYLSQRGEYAQANKMMG